MSDEVAAGGNGGASGEEGAGGGAADQLAWMNDFTAEDKTVVAAKGWTKPADIMMGYRNLEKMVGGKSLAAPNLAEPERLGEWEGWKALGVPDAPEGYEIKRPELAAGLEWDEAFEKQAREWGVMAKVPPHAMQGFVDLFAARMNGMIGQVHAQTADARTRTEAELKSEWGKDYDQNVELARQAARHYGKIGDEDLDRLDGILGSKGLMQLFADVGRMNAEASLVGGGKVNFTTPVAAAQSEIERLKTDDAFMKSYMNAADPNHKQAVSRMNALRARAEGERA